ncbi:unnamed protein product [Ceutorhynchus assimilis]|uniref:Regulatory protein zeste n=1 Tax=Ceutorhynchus assimilis TaxID=467358 RepID=A0A9N9ML67_9CUCU|nr:unnamed protein product [Ceutorhynchus assimilis]
MFMFHSIISLCLPLCFSLSFSQVFVLVSIPFIYEMFIVFYSTYNYYENRYNKMASRPTPKHWEIILDWLERNPEMVSGRGIGPTGKSNLKEKWENLAITLNSLGYTNKSAEKWMKTWTDFKCNLKRKAADIKKEQNKTGGGSSTSKALNEFEERALQLLGSTFIGLQVGEVGLPSNSIANVSSLPLSISPHVHLL